MVQTTQVILISVFILLAVYDLVVFWFRGSKATITCVIGWAIKKWPVIAFVLGFICGHIFW